MAVIFLSDEDRAGRPAFQSAPSLKLWSVSDLRTAGRPGAPKLWSVGRRSVKVFSTIQGARTGRWCQAEPGAYPDRCDCTVSFLQYCISVAAGKSPRVLLAARIQGRKSPLKVRDLTLGGGYITLPFSWLSGDLYEVSRARRPWVTHSNEPSAPGWAST
jgi:hypothetical protein